MTEEKSFITSTLASLIPQGSNRFQEAQFTFCLSPSQATDIAANRDIQIDSKLDYLYQVGPTIFI
jgi:hypothetical protein